MNARIRKSPRLEDYNDPRNVRWMCRTCHRAHHRIPRGTNQKTEGPPPGYTD